MSTTTVTILWDRINSDTGQIQISNGRLCAARVLQGAGSITDDAFSCAPDQPFRLELTVEPDHARLAAHPCIVHVLAAENPFSFFLRDVRADWPIVIDYYRAAVVPAGDQRDYQTLAAEIRSRPGRTSLEQTAAQPETTFEQAAQNSLDQICPIWLGLGRDIRIFEAGYRQAMTYADWVQPRFHGHGYFWEEKEYVRPRYGYVAGRGWACSENLTRRLDDDYLPIPHACRTDDGIGYDQTSFTTLEQSPLTAENVRGTHYLVADGLSVCNALNEAQKAQFDQLKTAELHRPEETVFCSRITATNHAHAPRYAFFKAVHPLARFGDPLPYDFDPQSGFSKETGQDTVFAVNRLNGQPMPQQEIAVLLAPGEQAAFEFFIPHAPLPPDRTARLGARDFDQLLDTCRTYWRDKVAQAASITLPEKRIENMLKAGLIHLDIMCYGLEPDGVLNMADGTYSALGSETTRNIIFFDSLGLHQIARRSLEFFLAKQHDDGFMQNFTGYMLETGAVLWCLGEHYRLTRDQTWLQHIHPNVIKACQYLMAWRRRALDADPGTHGYGLLQGKVADPEDNQVIYMLNGYAYLGLNRAAEMLQQIDPDFAAQVQQEAATLKTAIRTAFARSLAEGPVVPLANGFWSPTAAPWTDLKGPVCLFTEPHACWTHGTMMARDDMLGPLHQVTHEVYAPHELTATIMMDYHDDLMRHQCVTMSQPYYGPGPFIHLLRGERKPFLKSYYHALAALADRSTYSFWEHFYHESPHKTGDEAQFLLQTRYMLWLEQDHTLHLLPGIPRAWLNHNQTIQLENVASNFGPFSLTVTSDLAHRQINAQINADWRPDLNRIILHLPHPQDQKARAATTGSYDPDQEAVIIDQPTGPISITLSF